LTSALKETSLLLTGFTVLFFSGFFLANPMLICASFIPLSIYLIGAFVSPPETQIKKSGLPSTTRLGEIVDVKIEGQITGGPGAVVICDEVPEPFELVEGSNYRLVAKEFKDKAFCYSYAVRCTKCGNFGLGIGRETRHFLGLALTQVSIEGVTQLRVLPTLPEVRKIKLRMHATQRTHSSWSVARIGPLSTDFKEIRDYFYGDPFKVINWKASAKAQGRGKLYPMVNEYEREGNLSIWMFVDANPDLRIGTSVENALEHGVWAAYCLANYFLSKGYNLGMYVYNHRGEALHYDAGRRQFIRIAEALLRLTSPKVGLQVFWDEGFSKAVERNWEYVITRSPGIVIITHITSSNWINLLNGFRKILAYKRSRRRPNISVINILPYSMIPKANNWETFAAKMLDVASRSFSNQLRSWGLTVLDLDPTKESIDLALLGTIHLR